MKGELVYLYAFDVANEIMMDRVQEILENKPFPFEIRTDHTYPKDIPLYKPLAIELAPLKDVLQGRSVRPLLRVYEVGVVSIAMRVPFDSLNFNDLMPMHQPVLNNGAALEVVAQQFCSEAIKSIKGALVQATQPTQADAFTVFCLTDLGDAVEDVNTWMAAHRRDVAGLLTGTEAQLLSEEQVTEVLRIHCSYTKKDVAVIDWDAALVIDLTGYVDDVVYVLELANLQLEEYRTMDMRLDSHLNRAYDDLKFSRFGLFGRDAAILRTLRLLKVDVAKLNDEVTHITKFVGDWYLARIYLGTRERFHLDHWRSSVERRLEQLDTLYTVLHGEVSSQRMLWLEVLVAVFFVVDLLAIFLVKK